MQGRIGEADPLLDTIDVDTLPQAQRQWVTSVRALGRTRLGEVSGAATQAVAPYGIATVQVSTVIALASLNDFDGLFLRYNLSYLACSPPTTRCATAPARVPPPWSARRPISSTPPWPPRSPNTLTHARPTTRWRSSPQASVWNNSGPSCSPLKQATPRPRPTGAAGRGAAARASIRAAEHPDATSAARLKISPRTVQSHLLRVYDKLDITNRHALPDALNRQAWRLRSLLGLCITGATTSIGI